jgi:hypothetical protein
MSATFNTKKIAVCHRFEYDISEENEYESIQNSRIQTFYTARHLGEPVSG